MTDPLDFDGKAVVITGAAHGIGRAIAWRFARAGAQVALLDLDMPALREIEAEMAREGLRSIVHAVDVADGEAMKAAAEDLADRVGPCDVLVSNAGVLLRGNLEDADALAQWQRTIGINLGGCFNAAHAFAPQLRGTRGCIVNIASIHALVAVKNSSAYTASKGGVKQLTQALALELGRAGVRVNAVAPGMTETGMTQDLRGDPEGLAAFMRRVPLGRAALADDVANAVLFLSSPMAGCITGVMLPVDGGYSAT